MSTLALNGGAPVRTTLLPYVRHEIVPEDVEAVSQALQSGWLTTGPGVAAFEEACAKTAQTKYAVAVNSGTAALHAALMCLNLKPGDEVLVPAMTFLASANSILYAGAKPIFVDCDPNTLLIDMADVQKKLTSNTKALMCVDFAGQPCHYAELQDFCKQHHLTLISDACHSFGATYQGKPIGTQADLTALSFHAAKSVACGEGGMVLTHNEAWMKKMKTFRHHGMNIDHHDRLKSNSYRYDMVELGYNYRIPDILCALGLSQLKRLHTNIEKRKKITLAYDAFLKPYENVIRPLQQLSGRTSAHHLYTLQVISNQTTRDELFAAFRAENIGVIVTYTPLYEMSYYQKKFPEFKGTCPNTEKTSTRIFNLPLFSSMTEQDVEDVLNACHKIFSHFFK